MQAVILAAGLGSRLGALTSSLPKALLPIGSQPLICHSLDHLSDAGISETVIVTGYRQDTIRQTLGERHRDMPLRYVVNPQYAETGSAMSLLVAAPLLEDQAFILLESDLLYHPGFIHAAIVAEQDVILAADISGSNDEVYLCAGPLGQLEYLGKSASPARRAKAVGEFAGISRLSAALYRAYCKAASEQPDKHYEEVLFDLVQSGQPLRVLHCPDLPWTEIDNAHDLERATSRILPALRLPAMEARS